MNSTLTVILIVVFLLFITIISLYLHSVMKKKKWTCREGGCELDIDGEYDTKKDCLKSCSSKPSNSSVTLNDNSAMNYWACTKDGQCVKATQGYSTKEGCEQNCWYDYYPQSLIPAIRPNYWDLHRLWKPYGHHYKNRRRR
jgi:hypothetical protein